MNFVFVDFFIKEEEIFYLKLDKVIVLIKVVKNDFLLPILQVIERIEKIFGNNKEKVSEVQKVNLVNVDLIFGIHVNFDVIKQLMKIFL